MDKPDGKWKCRVCGSVFDGSQLVLDPTSTAVKWTCSDYFCGGTCDPVQLPLSSPTGRGLDELTVPEMHVLGYFGMKGGRKAGSFTNHLIAALLVADYSNLAKLSKVFPEEAEAVRRWQLGTFPGYDNFPNKEQGEA